MKFGAERTYLLFTIAGQLGADGHTYPAQTAVWSSYGETDTVSGADGAQAVVFGFPKEL